jgi:hypothetical protein
MYYWWSNYMSCPLPLDLSLVSNIRYFTKYARNISLIGLEIRMLYRRFYSRRALTMQVVGLASLVTTKEVGEING